MFIHLLYAGMDPQAALRFDASVTESALVAALTAESPLIAIPLHRPDGARGLLTAWADKEALDADRQRWLAWIVRRP